jgi:hypothetical protein
MPSPGKGGLSLRPIETLSERLELLMSLVFLMIESITF